MILKKIELENIKTHKKTSIPFKKGLNVLFGNNGAGKSTVLEMIGFILFDFLISNSHKDFVRDVKNDKPDYGTISLYIIGNNDEMFKIVRTIGKTSIAVYQGPMEKKLNDIDSIGKYKSWVKMQLGLKREIDLGTLFDTAIGIPQGMIINSFLESPKIRKAYFDRILQLESYELFWENLGKLKSKIKPSLQEIRESISNIKGSIENKEELIQKREKIDEEIKKFDEELKTNKGHEEQLKTLLEVLKELKTKLEKTEKSKNDLEFKKNQVLGNLSDSKVQLNEAKQANEICDNNREAHETYLELSSKYDDYYAQNEKLNELKDTLARTRLNHSTAQSLHKQKVDEFNKAKESKDKLKQLEPKFKKYKELENELNVVKDKILNLERDEK